MKYYAPFRHHFPRPKGSFEKRDCTVRAISIAASLPYDTAHNLMVAAGRQFQKPSFADLGLDMGKKLGLLDFEQVYDFTLSGKKLTLGKILKMFPSGRYVLHIANHAFAVIDGVVHDRFRVGLRTKVEGVWRVK